MRDPTKLYAKAISGKSYLFWAIQKQNKRLAKEAAWRLARLNYPTYYASQVPMAARNEK